MVGELVASSAALRFAGGWLFGVLLKQLAFLSLAALQARRMMVGRCLAGYAALDLRAVGPSVHYAVLFARLELMASRVVANKI